MCIKTTHFKCLKSYYRISRVEVTHLFLECWNCWNSLQKINMSIEAFGLIFLKIKLEWLFWWMDCAIEPWLMNFHFLSTELEDMDVDNVYLQQDGATCYTSGETIGLLREKFPGRVISRNGDYNWLPRSCGLTLLDFLIWG